MPFVEGATGLNPVPVTVTISPAGLISLDFETVTVGTAGAAGASCARHGRAESPKASGANNTVVLFICRRAAERKSITSLNPLPIR